MWGRRYLLSIVEREAPPAVEATHRALMLSVRPGTSPQRREEVLSRWYRRQLRGAAAPLIATWAPRLQVRVNRLFVQRMMTMWGSCHASAGSIRLNTELAKKTPECLEYVLVHELVHLIEPTHGERFQRLMNQHYPHWSYVRDELNRAPLAHVDWEY